MSIVITEDLLIRYAAGQVSATEALAARHWLADPANEPLARQWMQPHWDQLVAASQAGAAPLRPSYQPLLNALHQRLSFGQVTQTVVETAPPMWRRWAAAAVVAGMLAGGGWLLNADRPAPTLSYSTAYGQLHTLRLADGTTVTLNGNSTLRYAARWDANKPREVWLDGEGFFAVQHRANNQRFVVHTPKGLNVEVLGTKFTVSRRRTESRVVLLSGKVRVDFDDRQQPDVLLKPGELLETNSATPGAVVHKAVPTAPYASWKDAKLVLEETTIAELATRLQDTYGIEVVVPPALAQRRMSGTIAGRDLPEVVQTLEAVLHVQAVRQGNRLILSQ